MDAEYRTTPTGAPDRADIEASGRGLAAFNRLHAPDDGHRPLTLLLRDPAGTLVGGLVADTSWDWLHVDLLWVRADLRGQGHGGRLLADASASASRRGCTRVHLDTLGFQAPAFYRKHGYAVFGELPEFIAGQTRAFMWKRLSGSAASRGDRPDSGSPVEQTRAPRSYPHRP